MPLENGRDLFRFIPNGLFGPLVAPGASIYAQVLIALFNEWQKHVQPLSRESAIYCISSVIANPDAMRLTQDAAAKARLPAVGPLPGQGEDEPLGPFAADKPPEDGPQLRADAVLRYLTHAGWLRAETLPDFTQAYLFPGYATRLLSAFVDISEGAPFASQGLIFPIYDMLRSAVQEGEVDSRLPQAHRQTAELVIQLRELRDNIGNYLERVLGQMLPRDILDQMLTQYRSEVQARMLHFLHTTEHVSRYRLPVIETLNELERTGQIEAAARALAERKEFPSVEEARDRLREQAREIRDQFQALDMLLETIDLRHSQFVDAAVRSIELHLMSHTTTSGQLNAILEHLLTTQPTERQFRSLTDPLIQLYQLAWMDSQSLAPPRHSAEPFAPEPEMDEGPSEQELERVREEIVQQLQQKLTRERIQKVVRQLLEGRRVASATELPIGGPEDLPLVILVRELGHEGGMGYVIEEKPDARWVEMEGVGFREFRIRASKNKETKPNGAH